MHDNDFMRLAIDRAKQAMQFDEVPVGAVIMKDGKVISFGENQKERENCSIYHAEIVAIVNACKKLNNWYLDGCTLYVTLEPCPMCCGAIINSRIDKVVYGASDPKSGGVKSLYNLLNDNRLNHTCEVIGGVLEKECGELISNFFKAKREDKKSKKLILK